MIRKLNAVEKYGNSGVLEALLGLQPLRSQKIAAIITYAGSLEYYIERAILKCCSIDQKGNKPQTDSKNITFLISLMDNYAAGLEDEREKAFINSWCKAMRSAFIIRNNIVHGIAIQIGETLTFSRNPRWHGEFRKRSFGSFWADANTLDLVCDSMAVLLRTVTGIEQGHSISKIATPLAKRAVSEAQSILGEFSCQHYNPEFEKH